MIVKNLDQRLAADVVLIDLSKALNKIDNIILVNKMYELGVDELLIRYITEQFIHRKQRVIFQNSNSNLVRITCGVPQGTALSPLLFIIYINDLFNYNFSSNLLAYADDIKIIDNRDTNLQQDLDMLSRWCTPYKMDINFKKCTVLNFGKNNQNRKYFINNTALENKNSERDLG